MANKEYEEKVLTQSEEKSYGTVSQESLAPETFTFRRFCYIIKSLRIEPVMFLFMFSFILNTTCLTNMMMDKGCQFYFNYSKNVCDHIFDHHDERDNVEILANNYNLYLNLMAPIGAVVVIFIAPWSDKYSRKIPLTIALFGFFLNDIGIILCTIYFDSGLGFIILSNLPTQLSGGFICVMTIIYSHISEVSSSDLRSLKYTFLQIAFGLAVTLGALAGGQIYHFYGYLTLYTIVASGHLLAILWVVCFVPETQGLDENISCKTKFRELFSSKNFIDGFKTCLRPREDNGRARLWLLLLSSCTIAITYEVYTDIAYVYAHHMYGWDPTTYSEMWTIFSFTEMVVVLVLTPVLIRVLKFNDALIGIIGSVSIILKNIFLAIAYQLWLYYMSNFFGSLNGLGNLAVRSLMSKLVPEDELGKVFSFLATCEAIVPLLGSSVILKIFNATIKIFPGTCYFAATLFLLLPLGTFIWLFKRHRASLNSNIPVHS